jgi:hypothetical protein
MSLILDGTNGVSDIDGTAATPAIRGTDTNTGIFFGSDIIGFSEGGAEVARFNADAQFVAAAGTASLPVITTTGDVNTGIFFPAADTIAFTEGGAESMRISSGGEVGIGSTATTYKLNIQNSSTTAFDGMQVAGDNASYNLVFQSGGVSASGTLFGVNKARGQFISSNNSPITIGTLDSFALAFGTNSAERMRIDSSGNLLVGATATSRTGQSRIKSTGTQSSLLVECSGATVASGALEVAASAAPSDTSNYLIVATTSAVDKFYVYTNGNVVNANNSYGSLSDVTLKENIVDATPKLDKINSVRVVNYNLIGDEQKQIGVIAQELETVFPSMVEIDGKTGLKQVKYSVFVPMLIKAIQEQQALIENLTTRLTALENK